MNTPPHDISERDFRGAAARGRSLKVGADGTRDSPAVGSGWKGKEGQRWWDQLHDTCTGRAGAKAFTHLFPALSGSQALTSDRHIPVQTALVWELSSFVWPQRVLLLPCPPCPQESPVISTSPCALSLSFPLSFRTAASALSSRKTLQRTGNNLITFVSKETSNAAEKCTYKFHATAWFSL